MKARRLLIILGAVLVVAAAIAVLVALTVPVGSTVPADCEHSSNPALDELFCKQVPQ